MFFSKLDKIQNILDNMGKAIDVDRTRCVRLRAKSVAGCNDCMAACPSSAISVTSGNVVIDSGKCSECGVCCKVCKTGVFRHRNLEEHDFYNNLSERSKNNGYAILSCFKCNPVNQKDVLSVPCLGWVDVSALLWSIICGAKKLYFQYNDCNNCTIGCGFDAITREIGDFKKLLGNFIEKNNIEIALVNETPLLVSRDVQELPDNEVLTRRELFGYFKKRTKTSIAQALNYMSDPSEMHLPIPGSVIKDKIGIPLKKRIFTRSSTKIFSHLDESIDISECKYVGIVSIDVDKCNLCGVCYKLCPTGALKEINRKNDRGFSQKIGISLHSNECLKCNLCIELCAKGAVSYKATIMPSEYIDSQNGQADFTPNF